MLKKPSRSGQRIGTLLGGTGAAFLIGYVAKLALLRLYGPEAFGVLEFVIATTAILIPVASLRYEDALMLPSEDKDAWPILGLAATLTAGSVLLIAFAAAIIVLIDPERLPVPSVWIWSIPVLVLVLRASKIGELWATRKERFSQIASVTVTQSSVTAGLRLALFQTKAFGLITGLVAGHAVGAAWYAQRLASEGRPLPTRAAMSTAARRYVRFPMYSAPATLVGALVTRLPALLLVLYFDLAVLGLFGQAFAVLYVPLGLAAAALGQVFFVDGARAQTDPSAVSATPPEAESNPGARLGRDASKSTAATPELARVTHEAHRRLLKLVLVPVAIAAAAGPELFSTLFGQDWLQAGYYARYLSPWIALTAIASPLTRVFDVLERQRLDLALGLVMLAGLLVLLWMGKVSGDPATTMIILGAGGAVLRGGQIVVMLGLTGAAWTHILQDYAKQLSLAAIAAAILLIAAYSTPPAATTGIALALGVIHVLRIAKTENLLPRRS